MPEINGIGPVDKINEQKIQRISQQKPTKSFKDILMEALNKVNQLQIDADNMLQKLVKGEATQEEVVITFRKAQIMFELLMQIRNKLVDAYQEILRMRI
jgi:flagellar hook-basal body complex protein FliE